MIKLPPAVSSCRGQKFSYLACAAASVVYQKFYVLGYYPISEGWFSEYSHLIRGGAMPYRDFYLLLPPLYPLQIAAFQTVFGEGFLALRILGVVVTCAIALTLMDLLQHFFDPWASALAAVLGTVYYQSGNAYISYDFTQFLSLYLLIATALLVRSIIPDDEKRTLQALSLCAATGIFSALAALIKQSTGGIGSFGICLAGILIAVLLYRPRIALMRIAAFFAGFAFPMIATVLWLLKNGALSAFMQDTFSHALTAKGGGGSLFHWTESIYNDPSGFVRQVQVMFTNLFILLAVMTLVTGAIASFVSFRRRGHVDRADVLAAFRQPFQGRREASSWQGVAVCVTALVALYVITFAVAHTTCPSCGTLRTWSSFTRNYVYIWSIIAYFVGSIVALLALWKARSLFSARFLSVSLFGVGLVFGNGMSAGLSEVSTYLGITMLFAFLIDGWLLFVVPSLLPVFVALSFCMPFIDQKMEKPYSWWEIVTPPVRTSACADATGLLRGLCLPPDEYNSIMHIAAVVKANSAPDDPIYVYPNMPVFCLLSNRAPFENAVVSWFDFTTDELSARVSSGLETRPPPVIVMAEIPGSVLLEHERLFRHYQPLPQRAILASINDLVAKGRLKRIDQTQNLNRLTIDIYKRVDG
jgi:hypothetical protein